MIPCTRLGLMRRLASTVTAPPMEKPVTKTRVGSPMAGVFFMYVRMSCRSFRELKTLQAVRL